MSADRESLQVEVKKLQEILHSEDDTSHSESDRDATIVEDEPSDQIYDDIVPSESEEIKTSEHSRFDIGSALLVIKDLVTDEDSLSTCLTYNVIYQKIIEELLAHIEEQKIENSNKRDLVESFINDSRSSWPKVPRTTEKFYPGFRSPYFSTPNAGRPSENEDVKLKRSRGEIDMVTTLPKTWLKQDQMSLIQAVRDDTFEKLIQPLRNRLDLEVEKLSHCVDADSRNQIKEKLKKIRENLEEIKHYSNEKLLSEADGSTVDWLRVSTEYLKGMYDTSSCQLMWNNVLRPIVNRSPWTASEEKQLTELMQDENGLDALEISRRLGTNRTPFQCIQHYEKHLNKTQNLWTPEEDSHLKDVVNFCRIGTRIPWNQVCFYLEGRDPYQCLCRYMTINPDTKRGRWTKQEDEFLQNAVKKYGTVSWIEVAREVPHRTAGQCRERWCNKLNPTLTTNPWTAKEDIKLINLVKVYGKSWARIAQELPGRTDCVCMRRMNEIIAGFQRRKLSPSSALIVKTLLPMFRPKKDLSESEVEDEPSETDSDDIIYYKAKEPVLQPEMETDNFEKVDSITDRLKKLLSERMNRTKYSYLRGKEGKVNMSHNKESILSELRELYPDASQQQLVNIQRTLCGETLKKRGKKVAPTRREKKSTKEPLIDLKICDLLRGSKLTYKNFITDTSYGAIDDKELKVLIKKFKIEVSEDRLSNQTLTPHLCNLLDCVAEDAAREATCGRDPDRDESEVLPPSLANIVTFQTLTDKERASNFSVRVFLQGKGKVSVPGRPTRYILSAREFDKKTARNNAYSSVANERGVTKKTTGQDQLNRTQNTGGESGDVSDDDGGTKLIINVDNQGDDGKDDKDDDVSDGHSGDDEDDDSDDDVEYAACTTSKTTDIKPNTAKSYYNLLKSPAYAKLNSRFQRIFAWPAILSAVRLRDVNSVDQYRPELGANPLGPVPLSQLANGLPTFKTHRTYLSGETAKNDHESVKRSRSSASSNNKESEQLPSTSNKSKGSNCTEPIDQTGLQTSNVNTNLRNNGISRPSTATCETQSGRSDDINNGEITGKTSLGRSDQSNIASFDSCSARKKKIKKFVPTPPPTNVQYIVVTPLEANASTAEKQSDAMDRHSITGRMVSRKVMTTLPSQSQRPHDASTTNRNRPQESSRNVQHILASPYGQNGTRTSDKSTGTNQYNEAVDAQSVAGNRKCRKVLASSPSLKKATPTVPTSTINREQSRSKTRQKRKSSNKNNATENKRKKK